ncbi:hypothetical protein [Crossiella cryophila]|uniref:Secreted protein n=1 Tax=Crossiella cryophila TaxID=43355 RepID=A0A7W7C435_9PSEU|nr:hypothetical protein [Crossiella cryophila]MBB4674085.1 hypothetical protein [Crossiella cryophila]
MRRIPVVFAVLIALVLAAVPFAPAACPVALAAAKSAGLHLSQPQPVPDCAAAEVNPQVKAAAPHSPDKVVAVLSAPTTPVPPALPAPPQARGTPHAVDLHVLSVLRI